MKKYALILSIILFLNAYTAQAAVYSCTYQKDGYTTFSYFDPSQKNTSNYSELSLALKNGNCKEIITKKYVIDGANCNIQLYKYNNKVFGLSCAGGSTETWEKLKNIAKRDFGYNSRF